MGYFVELPGILINLLPLILLIVVIMSVKSKREEASRHPQNAAQRKLADDVIAAIERAAPDLEKAIITYNAPGGCYRGGSVRFKSQRGYLVSTMFCPTDTPRSLPMRQGLWLTKSQSTSGDAAK